MQKNKLKKKKNCICSC